MEETKVYFDPVPYDYLVVKKADQEEPLLAIRNDGTIEGAITQSGEAGRIFIESMRVYGQPLLERIHSLENGMRDILGDKEDPKIIASQCLTGARK
jgi:hypothetical protein